MRKRLCMGIFLFCLAPLLQYCTSDMLWEWLHSPDLFYLEVLETVPANNETNVPVNIDITAKLNDNIDPATLSSNFYIDNGVTGSINYNSVDKIITFDPSSDLDPSTAYCATLTTDVKTIVGETFADPCEWCFTTADAGVPEIDVEVDNVPVEDGYSYYFGILEVSGTRLVTVDIINNGTADLNLGALIFGGSNTDMFTVNQGSLDTVIADGDSSSFTVQYNPDAAGSHDIEITIPSDDLSESTFKLIFTGNALDTPQPEITILQGTNIIQLVDGVYDFGTVQTGDTSESVTFSIENTGSADLTIDSIVLGDKNADEFSLDTSGMLSVLVPGAKTNFNAAFLPLYNGTKKGSITIINNDPVNPSASFRVKGRGY